MKELIQRKNFEKREFRISDSKIYYNHSKFGNSSEVDIPFENVDGGKTSHQISHNILLLIALAIYAIAGAVYYAYSSGANGEKYAWLFWGIIATLVLLSYFITKQKFWKIRLSNNNHLFIYKNIPDLEITNTFIEEIIKSRNNYLIEQYAFVDENIDYDKQLTNLRWLRSIEVIDKKQFDQKYAELKKTVKPDKQNIGFGK